MTKQAIGRQAAAVLLAAQMLGMAQAQELSISPYSRYGLGDVLYPTSPRNAAMGGSGVATTASYTLNRLNPATFADALFTTLDVSGFGLPSRIRARAGAAEAAETRVTGSFQNLTFAFPANKGPVLVMGFAPATGRGYDITTRDSVQADTAQYQEVVRYQASGGLNHAFAGAAQDFLNHRLKVGATAAFTFGAITNRWTTETYGVPNARPVEVLRQAFVRGFGTQVGLTYADTLGASKLRTGSARARRFPTLWRIGATAEYTLPLRGNLTTELLLPLTNGYLADTLGAIENGTVEVPLRLGAGFELMRRSRWSISGDFFWQNWARYTSTLDTLAVFSQDIRATLGAEWTPDIDGKYHARMAYRLGGYFHRTPILVNGLPVNDFALTFGVGLPAARGKGPSMAHIAVALGQRGNIAQHNLRETYARIQIGVSINEVWFVRRVVD